MTYKLQTLVLSKMTFVCLLVYHKPHIDNMMQMCILLNMYLTQCVNTRSFIKLFSSSLFLLMLSPLFFHTHLFITNHLYSSKHCQNKIAFFHRLSCGYFCYYLFMCVCLWFALNSKIVCFCEFLCM